MFQSGCGASHQEGIKVPKKTRKGEIEDYVTPEGEAALDKTAAPVATVSMSTAQSTAAPLMSTHATQSFTPVHSHQTCGGICPAEIDVPWQTRFEWNRECGGETHQILDVQMGPTRQPTYSCRPTGD